MHTRSSSSSSSYPFNGPFSGTTQVSRYQKGKTNLDFTEARDSEWQWQQLGHMQVCTLLQTDKPHQHPSLSFLQAGCTSCRPTNSVKAPKAMYTRYTTDISTHTPQKGMRSKRAKFSDWLILKSFFQCFDTVNLETGKLLARKCLLQRFTFNWV